MNINVRPAAAAEPADNNSARMSEFMPGNSRVKLPNMNYVDVG